MNWYRELTITNGTMYAGSRWLGDFSSHEAAIEVMTMRREQRVALTSRDTRCCTETDLELAAAIDFDEK